MSRHRGLDLDYDLEDDDSYYYDDEYDYDPQASIAAAVPSTYSITTKKASKNKQNKSEKPSSKTISTDGSGAGDKKALKITKSELSQIQQQSKSNASPTLTDTVFQTTQQLSSIGISRVEEKPIKVESSSPRASSDISVQKSGQLGRMEAVSDEELEVDIPPWLGDDSHRKLSLTLIAAGHVDAGKSTLVGHMLLQMGEVTKQAIHKFKQQSATSGKSSFYLAWVMDTSEAERSKGVTIHISKR